MKRIVLGLDISTSCVGVSVIDSDLNRILLDHISFSKQHVTLWDKADHVSEYVNKKLSQHNITDFFVEEHLKKFRAGFSSAQTIGKLSAFNALVSYITRNVLNIEPVAISAANARKLCKIKLLNKKKAKGRSHKEQTFDQICLSDLSDVVWPLKKRSTNIVDWAADEVDAYVISKAGILLKD